jgi:hypothetical protein
MEDLTKNGVVVLVFPLLLVVTQTVNYLSDVSHQVSEAKQWNIATVLSLIMSGMEVVVYKMLLVELDLFL